MALAQRIRDRQEGLGIQQKKLSERLGWSQSKISHIVNGRRKVLATELPELAAALECSVSDLIGGLDSGQ